MQKQKISPLWGMKIETSADKKMSHSGTETVVNVYRGDRKRVDRKYSNDTRIGPLWSLDKGG